MVVLNKRLCRGLQRTKQPSRPFNQQLRPQAVETLPLPIDDKPAVRPHVHASRDAPGAIPRAFGVFEEHMQAATLRQLMAGGGDWNFVEPTNAFRINVSTSKACGNLSETQTRTC